MYPEPAIFLLSGRNVERHQTLQWNILLSA